MVVRLALFNIAYTGNPQKKHWQPCPKHVIMYRPTCKSYKPEKKTSWKNKQELKLAFLNMALINN